MWERPREDESEKCGKRKGSGRKKYRKRRLKLPKQCLFITFQGPTYLNTHTSPWDSKFSKNALFGLNKNGTAFNGEKNGPKPYLENLLTAIKPSWESPRFTYL